MSLVQEDKSSNAATATVRSDRELDELIASIGNYNDNVQRKIAQLEAARQNGAEFAANRFPRGQLVEQSVGVATERAVPASQSQSDIYQLAHGNIEYLHKYQDVTSITDATYAYATLREYVDRTPRPPSERVEDKTPSRGLGKMTFDEINEMLVDSGFERKTDYWNYVQSTRPDEASIFAGLDGFWHDTSELSSLPSVSAERKAVLADRKANIRTYGQMVQVYGAQGDGTTLVSRIDSGEMTKKMQSLERLYALVTASTRKITWAEFINDPKAHFTKSAQKGALKFLQDLGLERTVIDGDNALVVPASDSDVLPFRINDTSSAKTSAIVATSRLLQHVPGRLEFDEKPNIGSYETWGVATRERDTRTYELDAIKKWLTEVVQLERERSSDSIVTSELQGYVYPIIAASADTFFMRLFVALEYLRSHPPEPDTSENYLSHMVVTLQRDPRMRYAATEARGLNMIAFSHETPNVRIIVEDKKSDLTFQLFELDSNVERLIMTLVQPGVSHEAETPLTSSCRITNVFDVSNHNTRSGNVPTMFKMDKRGSGSAITRGSHVYGLFQQSRITPEEYVSQFSSLNEELAAIMNPELAVESGLFGRSKGTPAEIAPKKHNLVDKLHVAHAVNLSNFRAHAFDGEDNLSFQWEYMRKRDLTTRIGALEDETDEGSSLQVALSLLGVRLSQNQGERIDKDDIENLGHVNQRVRVQAEGIANVLEETIIAALYKDVFSILQGDIEDCVMEAGEASDIIAEHPLVRGGGEVTHRFNEPIVQVTPRRENKPREEMFTFANMMDQLSESAMSFSPPFKIQQGGVLDRMSVFADSSFSMLQNHFVCETNWDLASKQQSYKRFLDSVLDDLKSTYFPALMNKNVLTEGQHQALVGLLESCVAAAADSVSETNNVVMEARELSLKYVRNFNNLLAHAIVVNAIIAKNIASQATPSGTINRSEAALRLQNEYLRTEMLQYASELRDRAPRRVLAFDNPLPYRSGPLAVREPRVFVRDPTEEDIMAIGVHVEVLTGESDTTQFREVRDLVPVTKKRWWCDKTVIADLALLQMCNFTEIHSLNDDLPEGDKYKDVRLLDKMSDVLMYISGHPDLTNKTANRDRQVRTRHRTDITRKHHYNSLLEAQDDYNNWKMLTQDMGDDNTNIAEGGPKQNHMYFRAPLRNIFFDTHNARDDSGNALLKAIVRREKTLRAAIHDDFEPDAVAQFNSLGVVVIQDDLSTESTQRKSRKVERDFIALGDFPKLRERTFSAVSADQYRKFLESYATKRERQRQLDREAEDAARNKRATRTARGQQGADVKRKSGSLLVPWILAPIPVGVSAEVDGEFPSRTYDASFATPELDVLQLMFPELTALPDGRMIYEHAAVKEKSFVTLFHRLTPYLAYNHYDQNKAANNNEIRAFEGFDPEGLVTKAERLRRQADQLRTRGPEFTQRAEQLDREADELGAATDQIDEYVNLCVFPVPHDANLKELTIRYQKALKHMHSASVEIARDAVAYARETTNYEGINQEARRELRYIDTPTVSASDVYLDVTLIPSASVDGPSGDLDAMKLYLEARYNTQIMPADGDQLYIPLSTTVDHSQALQTASNMQGVKVYRNTLASFTGTEPQSSKSLREDLEELQWLKFKESSRKYAETKKYSDMVLAAFGGAEYNTDRAHVFREFMELTTGNIRDIMVMTFFRELSRGFESLTDLANGMAFNITKARGEVLATLSAQMTSARLAPKLLPLAYDIDEVEAVLSACYKAEHVAEGYVKNAMDLAFLHLANVHAKIKSQASTVSSRSTAPESDNVVDLEAELGQRAVTASIYGTKTVIDYLVSQVDVLTRASRRTDAFLAALSRLVFKTDGNDIDTKTVSALATTTMQALLIHLREYESSDGTQLGDIAHEAYIRNAEYEYVNQMYVPLSASRERLHDVVERYNEASDPARRRSTYEEIRKEDVGIPQQMLPAPEDIQRALEELGEAKESFHKWSMASMIGRLREKVSKIGVASPGEITTDETRGALTYLYSFMSVFGTAATATFRTEISLAIGTAKTAYYASRYLRAKSYANASEKLLAQFPSADGKVGEASTRLNEAARAVEEWAATPSGKALIDSSGGQMSEILKSWYDDRLAAIWREGTDTSSIEGKVNELRRDFILLQQNVEMAQIKEFEVLLRFAQVMSPPKVSKSEPLQVIEDHAAVLSKTIIDSASQLKRDATGHERWYMYNSIASAVSMLPAIWSIVTRADTSLASETPRLDNQGSVTAPVCSVDDGGAGMCHIQDYPDMTNCTLAEVMNPTSPVANIKNKFIATATAAVAKYFGPEDMWRAATSRAVVPAPEPETAELQPYIHETDIFYDAQQGDMDVIRYDPASKTDVFHVAPVFSTEVAISGKGVSLGELVTENAPQIAEAVADTVLTENVNDFNDTEGIDYLVDLTENNLGFLKKIANFLNPRVDDGLGISSVHNLG